jgi:Flp pilus assembly protein CpaB
MAARGRRFGRIIILVAIILILVLVLVWVLYSNFFKPASQVAATQAPVQDIVNIVITTQNVTRGTAFSESVLTTIPYPRKELVQGTFFTDMSQVVGKRAKMDIDARTPITSSLIADLSSGSNAAFAIPKGMVAISIPITKLTSVSFAPQNGDHVNIIVSLLLVDVDTNFQSKLPNFTASVIAPGPSTTGGASTITTTINSGGPTSSQGRAELDPTLNQPVYAVPSEAQRPRLVSQTLLQDATILRMGDFPTTAAEPSADQGQPTPTPVAQAAPIVTIPNVVTLIVTPQDAVTINYLMLAGAKLTLVLRGAGDDQRVPTEAVTLQYLMDRYDIPFPAKLPYASDSKTKDFVFPEPTKIP